MWTHLWENNLLDYSSIKEKQRCSWNSTFGVLVVLLVFFMFVSCKWKVKSVAQRLVSAPPLCLHVLFLMFPAWLKLSAFPMAELQDVRSSTEPPNLLSKSLCAICWVFAHVAAVCHCVESKPHRVTQQRRERPPDRPHYPLCWITWPEPWWRPQCLRHWIYVSPSCLLTLSLQCQQHIYGCAEV